MSVTASRWAMASPRLHYEPLRIEALSEFMALVQDGHVRRYLIPALRSDPAV